jgi:hypothetical protein
LFFKALKQNLKIKTFVGTSANAVRIQIWTALIAMLFLKYLQMREAFLRVFRSIDSFRFDCSFHTWLYRIVTNICLDYLRKRKVRKEEPAVVDTPEGPARPHERF